MKSCLECGSAIPPTVKNFESRKYCKQSCSSRANMRKKSDAHSIIKQCVACGVDFRVILSYADQMTCSPECDSSRRRAGAPKFVDVTCAWCGISKRYAYKHRCRKYCSASCRSSDSWNLGRTKHDCESIRRGAEKGSATRSQRIVAGEISPVVKSRQSWHVSPKTTERHRCRSPYEVRYLQMLDHDMTVASYRTEPFRIAYTIDGSTHHYVPDVLVEQVDGSLRLVEVKPMSLIDYGYNPAKFAAARRHCDDNGMTFHVVTEHELGIKP